MAVAEAEDSQELVSDYKETVTGRMLFFSHASVAGWRGLGPGGVARSAVLSICDLLRVDQPVAYHALVFPEISPTDFYITEVDGFLFRSRFLFCVALVKKMTISIFLELWFQVHEHA